MAERFEGKITQIMGPVVDVEFAEGQLPNIYDAIEVPRDGSRLILEVQQQLGNNSVRCLAMDTTDGLQRGLPAFATGAPIKVPVGPAMLVVMGSR